MIKPVLIRVGSNKNAVKNVKWHITKSQWGRFCVKVIEANSLWQESEE